MSKILSSKMPLDIIKICDYYFRRLRRIVPLYLFTILSVLITSIVMLFKLDYSILVDECVRPMLFIANWPADGAVEYSRRVSFERILID
jgi:peptidoglycan/LPS O-acetylase OafA/YrhL